jgi:hypothetical protein
MGKPIPQIFNLEDLETKKTRDKFSYKFMTVITTKGVLLIGPAREEIYGNTYRLWDKSSSAQAF